MKKDLIVIIGKENMYIREKNNDDEKIFSIEVKDYVPNVPFYHYLFDDKSYIVKNDYHYKKGLLDKLNITIILPEDSNFTDKRILEDYFKFKMEAHNIMLCEQCLLLADSEENATYISISKTIRCLVISYIKDGGVKEKYFFDKNAEFDEIINTIDKIKLQNSYESTSVVINNIDEDMQEYFDLGKAIDRNQVFENINKALNRLL